MSGSISAQTEIVMYGDFLLLINDTNEGSGDYPTSRIQKGAVLARGSTDVSEKGVEYYFITSL